MNYFENPNYYLNFLKINCIKELKAATLQLKQVYEII